MPHVSGVGTWTIIFSLKTSGEEIFSKKTGQTIVAFGGLELLATTGSGSAQEKGQKVQPPETGCYIGLYHGGKISEYYSGFVDKVGKKPKIITPPMGWLTNVLKRDPPPRDVIEMFASWGATPLLYRMLDEDIRRHGFSSLVTSKEFQQDITKYAKTMTEYGKALFFSTLPEMNTPFRQDRIWKGQPPQDAKNLWKYIWQVFEDTGANEYCTWVWEVATPEPDPKNVRDPEAYYPGDKYLDWIGLSAYSRTISSDFDRPFKFLMQSTYEKMRNNHPSKPIMMSEMGKTRRNDQSYWFKDAFETIKTLPQIKAAIVWDVINVERGEDFTFNDDTLKMFGQIFKDPYFIGTK